MEFSEGWQSIDAGFRDLNSWLDSELYNINNQTATALDFFKWSEMLNLEGIRAVRYSEIRDTAESVQERRTSIVEQIFIKNPEALNLKLALGMGSGVNASNARGRGGGRGGRGGRGGPQASCTGATTHGPSLDNPLDILVNLYYASPHNVRELIASNLEWCGKAIPLMLPNQE